MRHDIAVQDFRDFGENLGKYKVGATHVPVYRKDGQIDAYLAFPIPDFSMVADKGTITLVGSFIWPVSAIMVIQLMARLSLEIKRNLPLLITGLTRWQNEQGWQLTTQLGYTRIKGAVTTDLRGNVASPHTTLIYAGVELGKVWQGENQRLIPLLAVDYQHLSIKHFTDSDGTKVSYAVHNAPDIRHTLRYQWQANTHSTPQVLFTYELAWRITTRKNAQTTISGDGGKTIFHSGRGGDHL